VTLLPQAGVALGMAMKSAALGPEGLLVGNITLFAVLIYELIGPMLTKIALLKAGDIQPEGVVWTDYAHNGSAAAEEGDYERSAAGLKIVGAEAEKLGMLIALETHNGYLHDLCAPCRKLLDMTGCDAVGLNYDQGNIIINPKPDSIQQVFETVGDKIYYAHLKNMLIISKTDRAYCGCRLSDGHINTMEVMRRLKDSLRSGIFAVEFPNSGDGIYAAFKDMEYIKFIREYLAI
jgi:sugar phosphate isomerase/epimerase